MVDQPLAKHIAAGEVDRLHQWMCGQLLCSAAFVGHAQGDQVGVNAVLAQNGANRAHCDGCWQHGIAVRLDDHGVAGGERCKQTGVSVPSGEGAAADHQAHATTHDFKMLGHHQRWVFALWLFPCALCGHKALLAPSVCHGFKATVLCMWRTRLEGHHPALTGCHHHGVAQFEALLVQAVQHF